MKKIPCPLPLPSPAEIERAKTDADARRRVRIQQLRVKRREEEIARLTAENTDAGVHDLNTHDVHNLVAHDHLHTNHNVRNVRLLWDAMMSMFVFLWDAMMSG